MSTDASGPRSARAAPGRRPAFGALGRATILAACVFVGLVGLYQALSAPPWRWADEQAHTGYALALLDGRLPSIDTAIRVPEGAAALEERLGAVAPLPDGTTPPHTQVWVANHPPGGYLLALPGVAIGDASDRGTLVVLSLRLANVVGAMAAVVVTACLARELTGRADAGLVAACLTAAVPMISFITSVAMTDGIALAVSLGAVLAAARALRSGFDRRSTVLLAAAAVACGLTRLTALGIAVVVVGAALAVHAWRIRRVPWRPALAVAVPVAVGSGWFWALNLHRYGDVAGSSALLDRFNRVPNGSVLAMLGDLARWETVVGTLLGRRAEVPGGQASFGVVELVVVITVAVSAVILVVGLVLRSRAGGGGRVVPEIRSDVDPAGWLLVALAAGASAVMMAQHVSGGGNGFARYLLAVAPLAACVVAAALVVVVRRAPALAVAASALVGAYLVLGFVQLTRFVDTATAGPGVGGTALQTPIGPAGIRTGVVAAGVAAAAVTLALLTSAIIRDHRGRRSATPKAPARPGEGPGGASPVATGSDSLAGHG